MIRKAILNVGQKRAQRKEIILLQLKVKKSPRMEESRCEGCVAGKKKTNAGADKPGTVNKSVLKSQESQWVQIS